MIVNIVIGGYKIPENSLTDDLVKERLSPFKSKTISTITESSKSEVLVKSGEEIYQAICQSCHSIGLAGAPKFADKEAWASRLSKGTETLYSNAINGINAMPAKGGAISTPDNDIKNNIWFSINLEDLKEATGEQFNGFVIFLEDNQVKTPVPKKISIDVPNNHLKYAITWYAISISIIFYYLYFRRKK